MLNIKDIAAFDNLRTPFYYYDMDLLRKTVERVASISRKYGIHVHYAIKANVCKPILETISSAGFGADAVSGEEVVHAVSCGFPGSEVMFAGVGKSDREIRAALDCGVGCFNVESLQELEVIAEIAAQLHKTAPVAIRVNPNIDAHTHKYITTGLNENKFGLLESDLPKASELIKSKPSLEFKGLQLHIGSQITDVDSVFELECQRVNEIVENFEKTGLKVTNIDLGGGLGIDYDDPDGNPVADFETWMSVIHRTLKLRADQTVHVEPGRSIVAQCGNLIARVLYVKPGTTKTFVILDAGMNDLIRPALYGAYHKIENLSAHYLRNDEDKEFAYDIVGPVCESSDVWGEGRILRESRRGDFVALRSAGAYGQVMASRYNLHEFAPAVYSDEL